MKREKESAYPHQAIVAEKKGLLGLVPLGIDPADVDEAKRLWPLSGQRGHDLDALDGIIATDLDCGFPGCRSEMLGCDGDGPWLCTHYDFRTAQRGDIEKSKYQMQASAPDSSFFTASE